MTTTVSTSIGKPKSMNFVTYCCDFITSDFQTEFIKCTEMHSGLGDGCTLSIWLRHTSKSSSRLRNVIRFHRDVEILVRKSDLTPVRAELNLRLSQSQSWAPEQKKIVDCWEDSCHFTNFCFSSLFNDTKYHVVLQVSWNVPAIVDSGTCGNPYLKMSDFMLTDSFKDVKIIIDNQTIDAHKLVLSAASPVFHAMLTSPMKEGLENCIIIKDVDADIMRIVLKILYTGQDDDLKEIDVCANVLAVAEKYDMKHLKEKCERILLHQLTIMNALEMLELADTYAATMLKTKCMEFIIEHQKEVIMTENFREIFVNRPLLMMEFTVAVVNSKTICYVNNMDE